MPSKTSSGLTENAAGLLCYLLGWITGLIFFFVESKNAFVRFHAVQSIIVFGALHVLSWLFMPSFFWGGNWGWFQIINLAVFALWIFLMYMAFKGERYKLPVIGELAERFSKV